MTKRLLSTILINCIVIPINRFSNITNSKSVSFTNDATYQLSGMEQIVTWPETCKISLNEIKPERINFNKKNTDNSVINE